MTALTDIVKHLLHRYKMGNIYAGGQTKNGQYLSRWTKNGQYLYRWTNNGQYLYRWTNSKIIGNISLKTMIHIHETKLKESGLPYILHTLEQSIRLQTENTRRCKYM